MSGTIIFLIVCLVGLGIWRLVDRRPQHPGSDIAGVDVALTADNDHVRLQTLAFYAMAAAALCAAVGLAIVGQYLNAGFVAFVGLTLPWAGRGAIRKRHAGVAEVTPHALRIRTADGTSEYPWSDIADLRMVTGRESRTSWSRRMMFADTTDPFITVRLRRPVRVSFGFGQVSHGTDIDGFPIFIKEVHLFPEHPETLLELARPYLSAQTVA
jgi:hypothetical protein